MTSNTEGKFLQSPRKKSLTTYSTKESRKTNTNNYTPVHKPQYRSSNSNSTYAYGQGYSNGTGNKVNNLSTNGSRLSAGNLFTGNILTRSDVMFKVNKSDTERCK